MGYKQRQNFKKKLATRRAQRAEIAAMGQSEIPISELAPQVLQSKESKAKLRRWTFYTLITKQRFISAEGKVVDTEAEAMKDEKDQPVQKPIVHKLVTGNTVIGDEAMAKRAADEMREYYSSLDQHKGDPIKVFPVPHETVSHEVRNQMNGVKAQNDILQLALELVAEDFALGKTPESIEPEKLKMAYYHKSIKQIFEPQSAASDTGLVDAQGNAIHSTVMPVQATPEPSVQPSA
jgi:hypothetical protein